ncbi:RNA polymerase sigma factor [Chitinophaga nivalis]|uniref:Sigma-70 family RNA polymerase sigma factor n=1 Tax=Chitinophaga nivalis TaxID=2991709 RepID=A0ABT3ITF5_9BACT|nr:sigma-70 family RNA polymerase sigma factor [Chitinophaga nivalis]MCW3463052.1 sigma-70 family RNA polymerase sigma factor [Chitinophaga nivalis]MCW3487258.1 sigma-70 family RNA polymerase sigma factor [Chitinophaga nivalis]
MEQQPFLQLIQVHQPLLHKLCRLYSDTPEDREDLFQEMIYQLWKSYGTFAQQSKVSTWIYRIALNTALAPFRKRRPQITYTDTLPEPPPTDSPPNIRQEALFAALKLLSDAEKAIIALYLEDLSYQEIAAVTGIAENYVGVKLNRIKTKIKHLLKQ